MLWTILVNGSVKVKYVRNAEYGILKNRALYQKQRIKADVRAACKGDVKAIF